ncbi:unnamed protein product [Brassicogethes aeneus]|uniref:Uncharacterized protein n=1 Tax=Brassicogethes aeneus TaxID=1431903 RepID=A0A9P0AY69_BRAAE|nr:unnamed protein product [Brassicogethes aeneus]
MPIDGALVNRQRCGNHISARSAILYLFFCCITPDKTKMFSIGKSLNLDGLIALYLNENYTEVKKEQSATPLHLAALNGHLGLVKTLLIQGFDINSKIKHNGFTPLDFAIAKNRLEIVNFLIAHGADVNHKIINGFTPLSFASQQGYLDIVNTLIANGADLSTKTDNLNTPLYLAAENGHLDILNVFIEKGLDVNNVSNGRVTPLHTAVQNGNLQVVKALISHGSNIDARASGIGTTGVDTNITPLNLAVQTGKLDIVKALLEAGAKVNFKTGDKVTPLHLACQNGFLELVDILLKAKSSINAKDYENATPLHLAAERNHFAVVERLLHVKGIDVNAKDHNNTTALHMSSQNGHLKVVKLLIEKKAKVNAKKIEGFTPLHLAIQQSRVKVSDFLIKNGANINAVDDKNWTPLHNTAYNGFSLKIAQSLIEKGVNVNAKVDDGRRALHLAAEHNHWEITNFLIENGADVHAVDYRRWTPLHFAAYDGNLEVAKSLLAKGAYIDAKTFKSNTPLHFAVDHGHLEVVELLLKKGADVNALDHTNWTPLHFAAERGFDQITTVLLKHGADVTVKDTQSQCTALNLAAHYGHFKVVKTLKNAKNIQSDGNLFHGLEFAQNCLPSKSTMVRIQKAEATISKPEAKEEPEPELPENKRLAMEEKEQGNAFYKKKEFDNAIARYRKAIEHDPTDITFYNNLAAVHFEQKEFEKCVKECEKGIEVGRENRADFKLIAKSFIRIGNAYKRMKKYESAKTCYEKSLTEHRTPEAESLLSDVENVIKEEEIKAYFDMELAEKEKEKGNELFKKGDFAAALRHYCEAIKRNPDDAKLYSNRAACYTKLGLEDCDKCVELDPKFLKGFIRKGHILQGMQQQEKAIFAFLKALEIDPNNAEALHGLRACFIENSNLEGDQNSEKIWQRAKHDPEVQAILKLPAMRRILEQMQNDGLCQIS